MRLGKAYGIARGWPLAPGQPNGPREPEDPGDPGDPDLFVVNVPAGGFAAINAPLGDVPSGNQVTISVPAGGVPVRVFTGG
ncbi:MAG: hypothetical protein ACK41C_10515 [Phenylobacterium sp.]|uniref:hypothetical protein n=1 Tax=Phenylobacterium sp. TaxID=1871053 RepID=UPI00391D551A